jgi:hypothetical protein
MTGEEKSLWVSKGNLGWLALAVGLLTTHVITRHLLPGFTPPATPDKSAWMRVALYGELFVHIVLLGSVIVGIRNRIPNLKRPSYSDDGTLSIGSPQVLGRATTPRWNEIIGIIAAFGIYLAAWAWVYDIV